MSPNLRTAHRSIIAGAILSCIFAVTPGAMGATGDESATFRRLLGAFTKAQRDFNPAALAPLIAPDYVEVSPVGDVDPRQQMLEFYAPEKKSDAPAIAIDSLEARVDGRVAVVTARLAYSVAGINGQSRTVALRGGFLMKRSGGVWKIAFAQYTPMTTQKH